MCFDHCFIHTIKVTMASPSLCRSWHTFVHTRMTLLSNGWNPVYILLISIIMLMNLILFIPQFWQYMNFRVVQRTALFYIKPEERGSEAWNVKWDNPALCIISSYSDQTKSVFSHFVLILTSELYVVLWTHVTQSYSLKPH